MSGTEPRPAALLRLGIDFHVFDGIFQGSRSHLLGLYSAAIRQAPDIEFVFFLDNPDRLRAEHAEFGAENVSLVRMATCPGLVRLAWQLPVLRLRHRIHLLHTQYRLPILPTGPCACTIHDVLVETHPAYFRRRFVVQSKLTFRWAARRSALVFTVSEFSRGEISRLYGVPRERIVVTYNGVDRSRFFPGSEGSERVRAYGLEPGRYLLCVGRLEPRKNQLALVQALQMLGTGAPSLALVGQRDFGYASTLEAIQNAQSTSVHVLENVGDRDLPALMRNALAFVYPASAEGFGMPVAEAMASGVPVITSNTTSLPEVAGPGAILVPPDSVAEIAGAIRLLLGDEDLRREQVQRGTLAVRRFDWEHSAAIFLEAVRQWAARR